MRGPMHKFFDLALKQLSSSCTTESRANFQIFKPNISHSPEEPEMLSRHEAQNSHSQFLNRVEKGVNMPRMDGFLGLCDPYCSIRLGHPDPVIPELQTLRLHPTSQSYHHPNSNFRTTVLHNKFEPWIQSSLRRSSTLWCSTTN